MKEKEKCDECCSLEEAIKDPKNVRAASQLCTGMGFASILGSILTWSATTGRDSERRAHSERFGIFIGLWAPTFLILGNLLDRYADRLTATNAEPEQAEKKS